MFITKEMAPANEDLCEAAYCSAHTLIAGTTGSGKSVLLNTLLYSVIRSLPHPCSVPHVILFDTKRVELKQWGKLWNSMRITEPEEAPSLLYGIAAHMDKRYDTMEGKETDEPDIFVVIDELADLLGGDDWIAKECLKYIIKIGRLGRAAHIHLICCTQDPSRYTLTAQLMQNFTTCIALRCKTAIESRQIIGVEGAENLPKYGKAIISDPDGERVIDVPMISDADIATLVGVINQRYEWLTSGAEGEEPQWIDPELGESDELSLDGEEDEE